MKKGILFVSIIISLISFVQAQQSSSLLGFYGRVYIDDNKEDKGKKVNITLYANNDKISTYQTNYTGKFLLDIERNKHYTVVFEKEGYIAKSIIIKTYANPNELANFEDFKLDVVLLKKEFGVNYSNLDFPVAMIDFDKENGKFDYNQEYTENMVRFRNYLLKKN